jgi:hypothetical protein
MERDTREVLIEWRDEPEAHYTVTVCVDGEWTEGEDDENIFFYFRDLEQLEYAKEWHAGEDFRIVEVFE